MSDNPFFPSYPSTYSGGPLGEALIPLLKEWRSPKQQDEASLREKWFMALAHSLEPSSSEEGPPRRLGAGRRQLHGSVLQTFNKDRERLVTLNLFVESDEGFTENTAIMSLNYNVSYICADALNAQGFEPIFASIRPSKNPRGDVFLPIGVITLYAQLADGEVPFADADQPDPLFIDLLVLPNPSWEIGAGIILCGKDSERLRTKLDAKIATVK